LSEKALMRLRWMDHYAEKRNASLTCRHFDIPRSKFYYWLSRFDSNDLRSLGDTSRKPNNVRKPEVSEDLKLEIIELRSTFKGWGKVKIQRILINRGKYLGRNSIQRIINEAGLKRIPQKKKYYKRKKRKHTYTVPKEVLSQPGGLVYMDVKHLYLLPGLRVYQFTAIDHATRMMKVKLYSRITSRCGKDFLRYILKEYPFERIQYLGSDNGSEFLGELEDELDKLKIEHVFTTPSSPKQNPFAERMIKNIIDEVYYYNGLEISMEKQQEVLDNYAYVYNNIRPHHSLDLKTPREQFNILKRVSPTKSVQYVPGQHIACKSWDTYYAGGAIR
jgi:hypothetical protein